MPRYHEWDNTRKILEVQIELEALVATSHVQQDDFIKMDWELLKKHLVNILQQKMWQRVHLHN